MGTPALLEQVAMYFASLPCPPLPIMAVRECASAEDDDVPTICSSHDLLAQMLLHAMYKGNKALNEKRKTFQIDVTRRLIDALNAKPAPGPERTYFLFQQYTADYIAAFANQPRGVHFASFDEVPRGHIVHRSCCSWNAAQDIQHLPKGQQKTAKEYANFEYRALIQLHCDRVVGILERGSNPWLAADEFDTSVFDTLDEPCEPCEDLRREQSSI